MVGEGGDASVRSLQETPSWALATVCFVFIFIGISIEYLIHLLGHWLQKHRKNALLEAVEKLKSVLMLLGFVSLILAVTQNSISRICVSNKVANTMLPCHEKVQIKTTKDIGRLLAETNSTLDHCDSKGMTSLISAEGINQLSIFMGVLAVMQIVYSVLTMALGRAKMGRWKAWEKETQSVEYLAANDPNRFRLTRETTFGRRHLSTCSTTSTVTLWIKCFFRQFFHSVAKVDYLTLRHGFITTHMSAINTFNFQRYIQRSLEDDFKVVVGISYFMWLLVVILKLLDIHGWHVYLWVSIVPLIVVLILGTKMEVIVAEMAIQLKDQNNVTKGAPLVQLNDSLFWFSHPKYVLTFIHYVLFVNAFEVSFFVWVTFQFGLHSCYHEHFEITITRVLLAVMVQILCSYITLPLYALVTQMGTQYKSTVLEEQTKNVIRKWHAGVKDKRKKASPRDDSSTDQSSHLRTLSFSEYVDFRNNKTTDTKENTIEIVSGETSLLRVSSNDEVRIEI